jgi:hypothetical protein
LFLEYIEDRIGAIATIDPAGEWVITEIIPSLLCVLRQGGVEERLKVGGSGGCNRYRTWDDGKYFGCFEEWK